MTPLQEFVKTNGIEAVSTLGIISFEHPTLPLVGFTYDQIDSPKTNEVVRWSRGTVLEKGTWDIVAQSFKRFYNYGENKAEQFDWTDCSAMTKEDGSLILLYCYKGEWLVNTRGAFALGQFERDKPETWTEVFWKTFDSMGGKRDRLSPVITYIFELCSPGNIVIRKYDQAKLFMLGSFGREECLPAVVAMQSESIGIPQPAIHSFSSIEQVKEFLADMASKDVSFEGVVVRDKNNVRYKIKSLSFIALHHMEDNKGEFRTRRLIEVAMANETDEVLTYLPQFEKELTDIRTKLNEELVTLEALWESIKGIEVQKDFALAIQGNKYSGILFSARKTKSPIKTLWRAAADLIVNKWGK